MYKGHAYMNENFHTVTAATPKMNKQNAKYDKNVNKQDVINALVVAVTQQTVIENETYKTTSNNMSQPINLSIQNIYHT